jgi:hypothetical protein
MDDITIDVLNSFLCDELAAVETYEEALQRGSELTGQTELTLCKRSHEERASILRDKIVSLGGRPAVASVSTGAWGKLAENGAARVSPEMAIRALERGEAQVLYDYWRGIVDVDPLVRGFLERMILPEEQFTHRVLSDLTHRIASS